MHEWHLFMNWARIGRLARSASVRRSRR